MIVGTCAEEVPFTFHYGVKFREMSEEAEVITRTQLAASVVHVWVTRVSARLNPEGMSTHSDLSQGLTPRLERDSLLARIQF